VQNRICIIASFDLAKVVVRGRLEFDWSRALEVLVKLDCLNLTLTSC
jgi:hypothetical protein